METQVLVVGGGIAGLTAALALRAQGVRTLLVERHPDTARQPKARRFNQRSMEIYRSLGLSADIGEASAALANFDGMLTGRTLAEAQWPEPSPQLKAGLSMRAALDELTPAASVLCPQDALEPVLRTAAEKRGADVRFAAELLSVRQDQHGVSATVREGEHEYHLRADYVIAADGARSPIRESLGIPRSGIGHLADNLDIYFRADLTELIGTRKFNLCTIDNPQASGAFVSINGTDRWLFSTSNDGNLSEQHSLELLSAVIGADDVNVEIISVMPWESGMYVADQFSSGRIFLAGDAAHAMPPLAAAGANTAIQDVHNLCWKLAAVLSGKADPGLLDSYHEERYPVDYATAEFSSQVSGHLGNMVNSVVQGNSAPMHLGAAMFGAQYESGAYVPDERGEPPTDRYAPQARPGTRLPHSWIGEGVSTVDLPGPGFVLFAGPAGTSWNAVATSLDITTHQLSADQLGAFGIVEDGAVLVRPDGIVGWHSPSAAPDALAGAAAAILCRELQCAKLG